MNSYEAFVNFLKNKTDYFVRRKSIAHTTNNQIKFNAKVLTRFINYFETELDTIEFNYKNESNLTKDQKVKNYDTGNRNGYRFRYFNYKST